MAPRKPLLIAALLLVVIKCIQFAVDSQILFYDDSGAFLLNALGYAFIPERSYVYSVLIRVFSVSTHSLRAIVAMQVVMGVITAWLLAFILVRFFAVRAWIAIAAALAFAFDPVQIVHERLIMAETTAVLAVALFLAASLEYLRRGTPVWLVAVSLLGILLVSLRIVYLPVIVIWAVLLPISAHLRSPRRVLAIALVVSCGATLLVQVGYQRLTGRLAGREPAYHYRTGDFLVSLVAPLIRPEDANDVRVADAVRAQNDGPVPLSDPERRTWQMWSPRGFVARLRRVFQGDNAAATQAADQLAHATIYRDPLGYVLLGAHTYGEYWREIRRLDLILPKENGSPPQAVVTESGARMVSAVFGEDVSNQHTLQTPSRQYHLFGRYWNVFLLASPFVAGLTLWSASRAPAIALFVWGLLLFASTFLGASEAAFRYLHPFSFTAIATVAVLGEMWVARCATKLHYCQPPPKAL